MTIDKTYEPREVEQRIYGQWEKSGEFACDPTSKAEPFCLMMPPPNVTGSLHVGHALTFTLQDVLVRWRRMMGRDVLWQPGTDHAGIATQMVVERQLAAENKDKRSNRQSMGREAFLKRVWQWKAESGGTITSQLRRLGASPDWSRERFTMDEDLNRAVRKVFVALYNEGLIYRDKRLVNWDPKMLTAVSDLEVEQREMRGHMWHFRYPLADDASQHLCVATTRPETMLGDSAVAVNPDDARYAHLIGKQVRLPLTGRLIPIIADDYADPEKGSGAVKITPAHDFNDFAVWKRHRHLECFTAQQDGGLINIFDAYAKLNDNVPTEYRGHDRYEARKKVLAAMEELELLEKVETITHAVPHGDRSGVAIEPWLSEQWYCDAPTLAKEALLAVEDGRTVFVPKQYENTYFSWMRNIEPWCISRQLWWGHQIPAWYGPDGQTFVAETEAEAQALATKSYGSTVELHRDEDVLDTWFSAALWPFSTLGWPDQTPELARYYSTDVLITGFDIIFFWVARMMMMGLHFTGKVPFRTVYIHALVRDEKGQKMSKSKGNVIDPLTIMEKYGTDALRFTLANLSTPGRDVKLATSRIESGRNFATKLWNATRFCQMNGCETVADFNPAAVTHTINRWIVAASDVALAEVTAQLESFRFDLASSAAYDFVWNTFCDWYLELTKPILATEDGAAVDAALQAETRATTAWVLRRILIILHPFMPYITEELWEKTAPDGGAVDMLIATPWPKVEPALAHAEASAEIGWLIRMISTVRTVRAELNVPASAHIPLIIQGASPATRARASLHMTALVRLARLSEVQFADEPVKVSGAAQAIVDEATLIMPLAEVIDLAKERARLESERAKLFAEQTRLEAKLANPDFADRAPSEVVEDHRTRLDGIKATLEKLAVAQRSLAG